MIPSCALRQQHLRQMMVDPVRRQSQGEKMADEEWTVRDLMEALKRFPSEAKVYYEMGPNGPGTIREAQYVKVWRDEEMGVLLER